MNFNPNGLLPIGDHPLSLKEIRNSVLVKGSPPREALFSFAEPIIKQLWSIHVPKIYIIGSFVENKPTPSDLDLYIPVDNEKFAEFLTQLSGSLWRFQKIGDIVILPKMQELFSIDIMHHQHNPFFYPRQRKTDRFPKGVIHIIEENYF